MSVFDQLAGQRAVRAQLAKAAEAARLSGGDDSAMSHAWLFTGPPGSGRSVAALALAAALQCTGETPGCGECQACRLVMSGAHPDVEKVATEGVTITVDSTRSLVGRSYAAPSAGRWRVIIIEDADRMAERTTNVLLKAIEEPPAYTVWMLCTPSPDDVMPTIRSRCRSVNLAIPSAEDIAELLATRENIDPAEALVAAQAAQSHVGRAQALLTNPAAAEERRATLSLAAGIRGVGDAVMGAKRIVLAADAFAKTESGRLDEAEKAELARSLGVEGETRIKPALAAQFRDLEKMQKGRATRIKRDFLDRVMIDILSLYRDILTVQLGASVALVNQDFVQSVQKIAAETSPEQSVRKMDAIAHSRQRLAGNVDPQLTIEAMLISLRPQGQNS